MGTDVHIVLVGERTSAIAKDAQARIGDLEARWSRFIATSEVSRLNANAGYPSVCSPETVALVRRAIDAWRVTGGRFDPTVLGAVMRAGYDATFDSLPATRADVGTHDNRTTGTDRIVVDPITNVVMLPANVGFDPGGIGKGLAADIVSGEAMAAGAEGACVNVGGDVRVRGSSPNGNAWQVDVLDPIDPLLVRSAVVLADGAVATSSRARRAWTVGSQRRHHLLDPANGSPVENDVVAVTVVASDGWRAEVLAKAAFVSGVREGLGFLDRSGVEGAIFDTNGALHTTTGWDVFAAAA
ncbi:MAG: thiamine biosynthesis lipoprotein ApbE [Actinomycetia bacterium]|nr:thiamine biosynthesis lipoprotein ApbE [Actinomycetes bacterium]